MAPRVGLEPTTYRLTAERSTNWANGEYLNLATTYFLSKVTRKYRRHIEAWLLCSVWEQVLPSCNHHQKSLVYPLSLYTSFYFVRFLKKLLNIHMYNFVVFCSSSSHNLYLSPNEIFKVSYNISLVLSFVNILYLLFWFLFKYTQKYIEKVFFVNFFSTSSTFFLTFFWLIYIYCG